MADEINIGVEVSGNAAQELDKIARASKILASSTDKLAKEFKGTGKALQTAEKQVKKTSRAFDTFKGVLGAQALIGALKTFANTAVGAFNKVVDTAVQFEQLETKLAVLTGSTQEAQKVLGELSDFAAQTPFQIADLVNATSTLISFGIESENAVEKLKVLGDVSAGSGKNIQELAVIFGQVSGAGKLTAERLNQLVEGGVNVLPALAKELDTTQGAVRGLISKGQVDFKTFERAFNSLAEAGGPFFQATIKQSKTLGGVLSTLGDNVTLAAKDIGDELLPTLKALASTVITFIQENKDAFKEIGEAIVGIIPPLLTFADAAGRVFTFFSRIVMGALQILKGDFVKGVDTVKSSIDAFSEETLIGRLAVAALEAKNGISEFNKAAKETPGALAAGEEKAKSFTAAQRELAAEGKKIAEELFKNEDTIEAIREQGIAEEEALKAAREQSLLSEAEFLKSRELLRQKTAARINKINERSRQQELQQQNKFFSDLNGLSRAQSKELLAISKAASITQVLLNTPEAISNSFTFGTRIGGPAVGFVFAALAATAQAAQVAAIAGTPLQKGGEIPPGFPDDTFSARLTSGETVVPRDTTENLKAFLAEQGGSREVLSSIDSKLDNLSNQVVVQVGDEQIINVIRNAQDRGLAIS